jgi:hypothetical protein
MVLLGPFPSPFGSMHGGFSAFIRQSLERLSGNSYARVNLLTISRVIAA